MDHNLTVRVHSQQEYRHLRSWILFLSTSPHSLAVCGRCHLPACPLEGRQGSERTTTQPPKLKRSPQPNTSLVFYNMPWLLSTHLLFPKARSLKERQGRSLHLQEPKGPLVPKSWPGTRALFRQRQGWTLRIFSQCLFSCSWSSMKEGIRNVSFPPAVGRDIFVLISLNSD